MQISSNQRIEDTVCVTTAIEHLTIWDVVFYLHLKCVIQSRRMTSPGIPGVDAILLATTVRDDVGSKAAGWIEGISHVLHILRIGPSLFPDAPLWSSGQRVVGTRHHTREYQRTHWQHG